ncbi:single-stranded-DNA-specific exonuclease RecJ [Halococcus saccharolyticus]|uniref:Phosphoesterase RecJ domain-containing protein n=1 Tax=Halococcus saccharolyticus DSM 5350 TaxID=1227455 RepID=M0MAY6_9EURY|nr:DHH family phosphoesterase [Halococcus saccharolyticus]EMA42493.1 phosphoesterase RecJ domain-containing protein [Halococcus saccharolyticus DSM 5350]
MASPVPELADDARACADALVGADEVLVASHIDADGLTSAAVAARALERAEIPFEVVFEKQLDADAIAEIAATEFETVLFTDFGSGQLDHIAEHEAAGAFTPVIADHHQPADADTEFHLNPLLVGLDGSSELSGAGTTYVLARALAECDGDTSGGKTTENRDLAGLAVVGAVGDMQASDGELTGANTEIVAEGCAADVVNEATDLALYGKQTRPLPKLLEYATDVRIPGISGSERGAREFLTGLGLDLEDEGGWRRWVDLTADERQAVASGLVQRAVERGVPAGRIDELVGTTYTLSDEPAGTELRDASEFSTLLNATARYDRADVGLAVCLGDRDEALARARRLLSNHRRNLATGLDWVKQTGVTSEDYLQWFDAGDEIRETIVGIVAGMALGADATRSDKPIVAFAAKNDVESKVSARGSHRLVREGLDLSAVMGEAARALDGDGGGHDVAAGATIPTEEKEAFVERADAIVADQLG